MAFAVVDSNADFASSGATTMAVTASGVTSAQFLVLMVQVFVETGSTHGTVTDDASDTWTFLAETTDHSFQYFVCNSPSAGNRTITFHAASSMEFGGQCWVLLCTGGPVALDVAAGEKSGTGTAVTTNTITPAGAGELYLAMAEDDTGNYTLGSIQNSFTSLTGTSANPFAYRIYSGTTALGTGWTLSHSDGWATSLIALKPSSSTQTVSPSSIASAEAFGTATVTRGSVSVAPSAIASAEAFGSPTLTQVTNVSPSSIASAEAFGSPTLTPGAASVSVTGIASAEEFEEPTVTGGAGSIIVSDGIASAEAFGITTLTPGSVSITLTSGIASTEAFGTPILAFLRYIKLLVGNIDPEAWLVGELDSGWASGLVDLEWLVSEMYREEWSAGLLDRDV